MLHLFTYLAFALSSNAADVDRLVAFAKGNLSAPQAQVHLIAARTAANQHAIDRAILIAIAWNESRFDPKADGREANGTRACGLMGRNRSRCDPKAMTIVDGYNAGAAALRGWIDEAKHPRHPNIVACRKRSSVWQCAMMGYAGGWRALNICNTRGHRDCGYPSVVLRRAIQIRGYDALPFN